MGENEAGKGVKKRLTRDELEQVKQGYLDMRKRMRSLYDTGSRRPYRHTDGEMTVGHFVHFSVG